MAFRFGLYFLTITVLGLIFEIAEPIEAKFFPGPQQWFLLSNRSLHFTSYVYYTMEHLCYFLLAFIAVMEIAEARFYAAVFCLMEIVDIADFWTTANGTWTEIHGWPVTFNIIKVSIFVMLLTYETIRALITSRFAS